MSAGQHGAVTPECPACQRHEWARGIEKPPHAYARCVSCGLMRLDPFPTAGEAEELYGDGYFVGGSNGGYPDYLADAELHRRNARARIARLPTPDAGARLVDVGCAHGFTVVEARSRGWEPLGVDVNDRARDAVEAEGIRCAKTLEGLELPPSSVDAVTFFQSLEHLVDPLATLGAARRLVKRGGWLMIETWDRQSALARLLGGRWQQVTPPSVVWLFGRDDLTMLLESVGFSDVRVRRTTKWASLGMAVGQMASRGNRLASTASRLGGPRLERLAVPYGLGDLVTVTARAVPVDAAPDVAELTDRRRA